MDFGLLLAVFFILSMIIGWIIVIPRGIAYILTFILCVGKKECKKDDCLFREFCTRTVYSDKEKEIIKKKIESLN